ncbi:MAG: hypothetical protein U9R51_10645 [Actinomycetota bacterium]|nr:hypothetical protein [Actinomycetota bacterium]
MRILTVVVLAVLAPVVISCSSDSVGSELTEVELAWCADPGNFASYDAIWDAADELGVDTIGHFMLDEAGIATDVDPDDLSAADLTEEEMGALLAVGDDFDSSDDIWLEYLATEDGTKACQTAYASSGG